VIFRVYCETSYGQTVHVVGNMPTLGNWLPTENNKLKWSELNWWETYSALPVILPRKQVEYKFVIKDESGNLQWESGENRVLILTGATTKIIEAFDCRKKSYNYQDSLKIKVNKIILVTNSNFLCR
jgi:hypothetical protein